MTVKYELELTPMTQPQFDPDKPPSTFWSWSVTRLRNDDGILVVEWSDSGICMSLLHANLTLQDALGRAMRALT